MRKGKKLVKRCLLHCLRSPHTHYTTLHTGLMLTRGISALWLVLREESSSHTIWIFTNAHSKFNSQWLTPTGSSKPVGILYLLPYMTLTKQLLKVALTHVPLKVVLKLLQLFVETMATIGPPQYIHVHGRN